MSAESFLYTVVIPTYNRAGVLPEALESVFAQRVAGVQVVVVDDGSTDETRQVVASYGDRVLYLSQENRGPGAARNAGVEAARGEFIGFLDSDDVWLPGKIERELHYFRKYDEAEAVISDCDLWVGGELTVPSMLRRKLGAKKSGLTFERPEFMPANPLVWTQSKNFGTSCITLRRASVPKLGGAPFDSSLSVFEDFDFEVRLLRACRVLVVPEILVRMRRFDDGTRFDRPAPGRAPTPEQARLALRRRHGVMDKILRLGGWPADVVEQLENIKREIAAELGGVASEKVSGRELTVVVGVRARADEPERRRNAEVCLQTLNRQSLERRSYRIVVVEQDKSPQHEAALSALADEYIFAYNPGLYNRGWGFNIGASLAGAEAGVLFLADADLLFPPDFLRRGLTAIGNGAEAILPYSEVAYLDPDSTERAVRDYSLAPDRPLNLSDCGGKIVGTSQGGCIWVTARLYRQLGGHDERYRGWGGEDRDFWRRLSEVTAIETWPDRLVHLHHRQAKRSNPIGMVMPPAPPGRRGDLDLYASEVDEV